MNKPDPQTAGIDLGTTYSLVGHVSEAGKAELSPDRHVTDNFRTPSIVHIGADGCLVGETVLTALDENPALPVVQFPKLSMGQEEELFVDSLGRSWLPEAVSALILRKLCADSGSFRSTTVDSAVIAVPAQFNTAQRDATRRAGILAGLDVMRLIEEPVAAATFYGLAESPGDRTLFVYDLGGGTFDATILQASPQGLYVLGTDGARQVGGNLFDETIMRTVADDFKKRFGIDVLADPIASLQLRRFAEQAKIKLSSPGVRQVHQTILLAGKTFDVIITRAQFEKLITPFLMQTIEASERCLQSTALSWGQIDKVLLTGGSTLMPLVSTMIQKASGLATDKILNEEPHHAVAYGAGLVAQSIAGKRSAHVPELFQQITSFDLSMRVWDKAQGKPGLKLLIKRNSPLPTSTTTTFFTTRHDQTRIVFELVQSKGETDSEQSLGSFSFGPIRNPKKNYPVEITIAYDLSGIVKVTARDPHTGEAMEQIIENEQNKSSALLARMKDMVSGVTIN